MIKNEFFVNILKTFLTGSFLVSVCFAQGGTGSATVMDADGNVYHTVTIGNQVWTVENLLTTKYNDGTAIPIVKDSAAWRALKTPGYCYYNNKSGFSALPGGCRSSSGTFNYQSGYGGWWSATESNASDACNRTLVYGNVSLGTGYGSKSCGFAIRLVKD